MIDIQIKADSRYAIDRRRIRATIARVLSEHRITAGMMVSVLVVGDRKMRVLNRDYHEIDATTDVLSFPYLDRQSATSDELFISPPGEDQVLGDLVLCYPQAVKQAGEKQVLVDDELDFLVEHGMLHLLGQHHD